MIPAKTKSPWQNHINSVKDESYQIRGATLIYGECRTLCGIHTYPRQLTYAHTLRYTLAGSNPQFRRTLSGPFDDLFSVWLSAPQTLCGSIITVISASTVHWLSELYHCKTILSKANYVTFLNRHYTLSGAVRPMSQSPLQSTFFAASVMASLVFFTSSSALLIGQSW